MSFYIFSNGNTASAYEMTENFKWGGAGDRLPRDGVSLTAIDATYNLGASTAIWDDVYCNYLEIANSVYGSYNLWVLLDEVTLSATASSIEFTGLNGDTQTEYMIQVYYTENTQSSLYMIFNGDSAANYGGQRLSFYDSHSISSDRTQGATEIITCQQTRYRTTTAINSFCRMFVSAKTNTERTAVLSEINSFINPGVARGFITSWIWDNTASTITSIKFYSTETNGMETGTTIKIWGRG